MREYLGGAQLRRGEGRRDRRPRRRRRRGRCCCGRGVPGGDGGRLVDALLHVTLEDVAPLELAAAEGARVRRRDAALVALKSSILTVSIHIKIPPAGTNFGNFTRIG